ncbi:SAM-dependent methyltransferase [Marinibactrum halimedae]|uniref:Cyclopropane-fatty-acyl-phospholipid synthase n=1 Tax=Marinibactrum halimedae TaxID=1444977 RepID=A0AA37WQE4_9GAMM|nr:cyclopropane-fatty-acyl-phospholipid synthase family protein [Marinibactrum halimedae]MCD9457561.1 cyclopropane-fatty-acyl-phospholipid synthase family protein [Marinibactrum halimedae]GLS27981.1 cyclopropane-fatty-acyl-phospholipid synthase [Marinibactrum halimedae]
MRAISIDEARVSLKRERVVLDKLARDTVFKLLDNIKVGHLVLEEDGRSYTFGEPRETASVVAHISVKAAWAYRQVLFNGSIGSGEAYMLSGWTSSELVNVVRLMVLNQQMLQSMDRRWSRTKGIFSWLFHKLNANTVDGSKANISAHYDLGNDFFRLFLDPTMMYSSAIFPKPDSTLEEASLYKLEHICERLHLTEQDHLLEIGTGWGGMAIYAAEHYGCKVTTTTISREQYEHALAEVQKRNLEDRITVLCEDYRNLTGTYDKLVSIEMIEAVGHKFYRNYFERCSALLKPKGLMLIQAITISDQRYEYAKRSVDFIQRYIFPGGALPSVEVIANNVRAYTDMQMINLDDITLHYAETLAQWRQRFQANIQQVRSQGFDEIFERMWEFYLCYCEGGFRERVISTVQVLLAKPDARELPKVSH